MSVVTGKSGHYRYYKCSARMSKGNTACPSQNFPMDKIDNLVLDAFHAPKFIRRSISAILSTNYEPALKAQRPGQTARLKKLEAELKETERRKPSCLKQWKRAFLNWTTSSRNGLKQHKQTRETCSGNRQPQAPAPDPAQHPDAAEDRGRRQNPR